MLSRILLLLVLAFSSFQSHSQRIIIRQADSVRTPDVRSSQPRRPVLTRWGVKMSLFDVLTTGELKFQTEFTLSDHFSVYGAGGINTYVIGQLGGYIYNEGYYPEEADGHGGFGWVYSFGARYYMQGDALDDYGVYFDVGIHNRKYAVNQDYADFNGTLYHSEQRLEFGRSLVDDNILGDLFVFIGVRKYRGMATDFQGFGFPNTPYEFSGRTTSFGIGLRIGYTDKIYK